MLEASYIVYRLPPFHRNLGKRLVKTPKLYFYDTGLVASLLGIERPEQLETHPLRGPLFETWVLSEITKHHLHRGRRPRLSFYRDRGQLEIDLVLERGTELTLVEVKSAQTPTAAFFSAFERFAGRLESRAADLPLTIANRMVVYGGGESQDRRSGKLLSWSEVARYPWAEG